MWDWSAWHGTILVFNVERFIIADWAKVTGRASTDQSRRIVFDLNGGKNKPYYCALVICFARPLCFACWEPQKCLMHIINSSLAIISIDKAIQGLEEKRSKHICYHFSFFCVFKQLQFFLSKLKPWMTVVHATSLKKLLQMCNSSPVL